MPVDDHIEANPKGQQAERDIDGPFQAVSAAGPRRARGVKEKGPAQTEADKDRSLHQWFELSEQGVVKMQCDERREQHAECLRSAPFPR